MKLEKRIKLNIREEKEAESIYKKKKKKCKKKKVSANKLLTSRFSF